MDVIRFNISQDTITVYEANISDLILDLDVIVRRLVVRGKTRPDAFVQPLSFTHLREVAELHTEFPCPADLAWSRLVGKAAEGNYCWRRSVVLTIGRIVAGAVLIQPELSPSVAFVYGVVVARCWRHTWANVILKHGALMQLRNLGTEVIRFQAASKDTQKHAARAGARMLRAG